MIGRRRLIGSLAAMPLIGATDLREPLTLYSPAPPDNPMHAINLRLAASLARRITPSPKTIAMPLPQSVHHIAPMPRDRRAWHWPIMTTVDFLPARAGGGPGWHPYPRACPDLRFVAMLYDVGFGISVWNRAIRAPADLHGRRIAVPPRPSAVRLLAEALLNDGWGLANRIEWVDLSPAATIAAAQAGTIDATAWNLVLPDDAGFRAILDSRLPTDTRFLSVDADSLARIHAAHPFRLRRACLSENIPPLLSFAQSLAAWDEADGDTVRAVLDHLAAGPDIPGLPRTPAAMRNWPGLDAEAIHTAARDWYRTRGA